MQKRILFLGAFLLGCTMLPAQRVLESDTISEQSLEEATVTATRASRHTPVAFTNLSRQELDKRNFGQDIPYLLATTPSVTMASDAGAGIGYTYLRIRGTDPTRINVTANGIPLNDAESNALYWVNMGDFASSLGSIQVQRGVGTSTNGSGAFGASVNMQTENATPKPFFRLDGSAGSYGTHKESAQFSTGMLGKHWAVNGRLSNIGTDGYIDRASANLYSYFLQAGYYSERRLVKFLTFNGTERSYLSWDYATREDQQAHGRTYNPSGKYKDAEGNTRFYKDQVDDYHQQHYQFHWTERFSPALTLNAALHYTRGLGYYETYKADRKLYEYALESTLGSRSDLVRRKYSSADFYGTVLSLNYKKDGLDVIFGGGWNKYDGRHYGKVMWVRQFQGDILPQQPYYRNWAHKQDLNIYGRANWEIVKGLTGYLDLQYRYVDFDMYGPCDEWYGPGQPVRFNYHENFSFFNPKAGFYYDITPHHNVYVSHAIAHKEPTRNDYEDAVWSASKPRSERLDDTELGYKYRSEKFSAGVNFYLMKYKDQFVLTGEQDQNGEFVARNVGDSYRRGVELTAAWKPLQWFRWDYNMTWSHNRIKDYTVVLDDTGEAYNLGDTPISYSPSLIANNIFAFDYKGFTASLHTQYVGRQYMTNTGFRSFRQDDQDVSLMLDDYCVSNLDLSYAFRNIRFARSLSLGITIYNLFAKKYDANGAAYACLKSNGQGGVMAYQDDDWNSYAVFSAQAPAHFLVHCSITF
ncbi:MAG: TonB-dependent receptor [Alloprevotella sp.]|nr:TonB-dependent receptor [Alloprevotella sp.]MBR1594941.1 TonB-dependent receptor [Alloprevotella sp.]